MRPTLVVASIAGGAALLAACGGSGSKTGASAGNSASFPVTITDCGRSLTFTAPPKRVVILSPIIARDLIALGVGNRIIGQSGTNYFPPLPQMAKVPVLSHNNLTSTEVLLGARPDLVISDDAYRLDPNQGGASIPRLQQAGVQSYVTAAGCNLAAGTVADEFTDVANLGAMFGVRLQAKALVTKLRAQLADVERRVAGQPKPTVFEGTLYGSQYYPVSGIGLDALGLAGGSSIFPQVQNPGASVAKEKITAPNPQVIISQNSFPGSVDQQKATATLKSTFPTTAAVMDNRIYFVDYVPTGEPGSAIETVNAVEQLAKILHPQDFSGS